MRIYDASRANANPKKIYCIDHAMVTSIASGILVNDGHRLENLVYLTLRRETPEIHYYKTNAGREIDFIALIPDAPLLLVQVCETLVNTATRQRELIALQEAMIELNTPTGLIVTRNEAELVQDEAGEIEILPLWCFLSSTPDDETSC